MKSEQQDSATVVQVVLANDAHVTEQGFGSAHAQERVPGPEAALEGAQRHGETQAGTS